jgi:hypothetical protein
MGVQQHISLFHEARRGRRPFEGKGRAADEVWCGSVYYLFFEESRAAILKGKETAGKVKATTLNMFESILASFIAGSPNARFLKGLTFSVAPLDILGIFG